MANSEIACSVHILSLQSNRSNYSGDDGQNESHRIFNSQLVIWAMNHCSTNPPSHQYNSLGRRGLAEAHRGIAFGALMATDSEMSSSDPSAVQSKQWSRLATMF
jgi:hypothetical protein